MKRNLLILLTSTLLFSSTLAGCGSKTVVSVNVENEENLHNTIFGEDTLKYIGNDLYYDSTTRIVYMCHNNAYGDSYTAYYAPNGLPYRYNPETNTFEEIDLSELLNLEMEE
jgi:hypothetical protein